MQRNDIMKSFTARSLAWIACLLTAWAPTGAQEADGTVEPAEPFAEIVNVEIVNVDVYVTDNKGNSVTGLTRDDFVIKENGKPIEVANFYAVEDGRPTEESAASLAGSGGELDAGVELREIGTAPEHRLWLVVYIDNFNIHPLHRRRIFPDLRLFLGKILRDEDQAMVATFDRSLEVRQPFTDNSDLLFDALDTIQDDIGHVTVRNRERSDTLKRIADARSGSRALGAARQYAESQMNDINATTRALREVIDSLAGLPGRKAMLYVTSGVPMRAGEEMFHAVASTYDASTAYAEIPRHDTSRSFESLGKHANANRVVFYTMDASGLRSMQFGGAEYGSFMTSGLRSTLESTVQANEQESLRFLADETGGMAIVNRNATLPALDEVGRDLRTYYSLGIQNNHPGEGRYYDLEVEVNRPNVKVRHRNGYRSKSMDSRMGEMIRSALLYDKFDNPFNVSAEWARPTPDPESKNFVLATRLQVPLRDIVFLPTQENRWEMRLKVFVGIVDRHGDISEIDSFPVGLRLAQEHVDAAQEQSYQFTHRLLVEKGRQKVAVAVLDQFGNRSSIISQFIQAGDR